MLEDKKLCGLVQDLPFGEQFLLWALRQWVKGNLSEVGAEATLHKGFRLAGVEEGYVALDELLTIVAHSARAPIEVPCPHCAGMTADEQVFLGLIAALQRLDLVAGRRLLGLLVADASVRLALPPAARLAQIMWFGRLVLRPRAVPPAARGRKAASAHPPSNGDPAPPTIH